MNQQETIINYLLKHDYITQLTALGTFRVFNLKGRIADMRGSAHYFLRKSNPLDPKYKVDVLREVCKDATDKTYVRYYLTPAEKHRIRRTWPTDGNGNYVYPRHSAKAAA